MSSMRDWAEPYLRLFAKLHPDLNKTDLKIEMEDVLDNMRDTIGGSNPESLEAYIENGLLEKQATKIRKDLRKISTRTNSCSASELICRIQTVHKKMYQADIEGDYSGACVYAKLISNISDSLREEYLRLMADDTGIKMGKNE